MSKRKDIKAYLDFARPYYTAEVPGGFAHAERLAGRLDEFARGVTPEPLRPVLWFLAAFHGLRNRLAGDASLRAATAEFLRSIDWTDEQIARGLVALARHASEPMTVEEMIVHDADHCEMLARPDAVRDEGGVTFRTPAGRRLAERYRARIREATWRSETLCPQPTGKDGG